MYRWDSRWGILGMSLVVFWGRGRQVYRLPSIVVSLKYKTFLYRYENFLSSFPMKKRGKYESSPEPQELYLISTGARCYISRFRIEANNYSEFEIYFIIAFEKRFWERLSLSVHLRYWKYSREKNLVDRRVKMSRKNF